RMKRSIVLRTHFASFGRGGSGRFGATNDQCVWYFAPCSIHALSTRFCCSESVLLLSGGGILNPLLLEKIRLTSALLAESPGTIAIAPDSAGRSASSRTSSRSSASRSSASGPWHLKQLSARIGRTWRSKSTASSGAAAAVPATALASSTNRTDHHVLGNRRPVIVVGTSARGRASKPLQPC